MQEVVRRRGVPAEDLVAVVRVHTDRVHDAVRRLGVDAAAAVEIVESSALALVDAVASAPERVPDAAGWWFAEARDLAARAAANRPDLPLGGGLLSADEDQLVLAEAVEELPADERLALLLRDAYRLPFAAVAAALRVDEDRASGIVARARLHAVPLLDDEPAPPLPGHAASLGALGRLGESGEVAPADATVRRHVQACTGCAAVTDAQARVHVLLSGLAVVALPEAARTRLLARVEERATAALPSAASLVVTDEEWEDWDDDPRILRPLLVTLGVVLAVVLGTFAGVLASRGAGAVLPLSDGPLPAVTLPPVEQPAPLQLDPAALPPVPPVEPPRTRVFEIAPRTTAPSPVPSTTAAPSPTASAPAEPTGNATLTVDPRSGPDGATLEVTGAGWTPGGRVVVEYLDPTGRPTGSRTSVEADADGAFQTQLVARDPQGLPGRHTVRATGGQTVRSAPYEVTA